MKHYYLKDIDESWRLFTDDSEYEIFDLPVYNAALKEAEAVIENKREKAILIVYDDSGQIKEEIYINHH